jgi:hypothetical protein
VEALIPITLFMSIAAVLVLRPISKKLGGLIEATTRDRVQARGDDAQHARVMLLMEQVARRLDLIEERLDFTERLVASRDGADARRMIPRRVAPRIDARAELFAEDRLEIGQRSG